MKICIIGGGHSGWYAAAYIEKNIPEAQIDLYYTNDIPKIGVGESTLPQLKWFFDNLGINSDTWMSKSNAIIKTGNRRIGWSNKEFVIRFWYDDGKQYENYYYDNNIDLEQIILNDKKNQTAYHIDAEGSVEVLKDFCKKVNIIESNLDHVLPDYDLTIDCSGFNSKFAIDKTEMDISNLHMVDSAWVCPVEKHEDEQYTQSISQRYGWQFIVPLQNREGTGYIYSSKHTTDDDALIEFEQMISHKNKFNNMKPRLLKWRPKVLANPWTDNVVSIGISAGFVDPLEATSFYMTQSAIEQLVKCLKKGYGPRVYNKQMQKIWKECLEFVIASYVFCDRNDSEFWQQYKNSKQEYINTMWKNYSTRQDPNKHIFPSGIWAQLAYYHNIKEGFERRV